MIILIASSISSYLSIQNQMNHRESVGKSRRSVTAVKDILVSLLDAETGNRGYQLTGKESFLEPYNRSMREYSQAIERAESLDIEDPKQEERLMYLKKNVESNISNLKLFVENRKKGIVMTQDQILQSKIYMDRCRKMVDEFVKYEDFNLEKKTISLNNSSNTTVLFIIFSALSAIAVTAFFYFKLRSDLIRREKLENALRLKDIEITKRVSAIQQIANRVANGDYSQKAEDDSQDDLGDLADSLNHMTESLKISFDKINKSEWRQKGLVILNESLVGNKSVKDVSEKSLQQLLEYGNCINGSLYLYDEGIDRKSVV